MKIDPQSRSTKKPSVKHCFPAVVFCILIGIHAKNAFTDENDSSLPARAKTSQTKLAGSVSQPQALVLLREAKQRLAMGPGFNAKIRQRVWTAGRLVDGVGAYEQAGQSTGWFNLQVSMHDGDGKHTLQQISDGRLSWTRTVIGESITLKRVDVGRLDEWVRASSKRPELPPRLEVGAFTEMLSTIQRDYVVKAHQGRLNEQKVLIITGRLKEEARNQITREAKLESWPELYPSNVRVAIALQNDPKTGFGMGLPIRFEYRGAPIIRESQQADASNPQGPLISMLELYSIHPIASPPVDRFRFDAQEVINFSNETDYYLRQYGIRLTESQRRQLLR